jgi:hypothetical protein
MKKGAVEKRGKTHSDKKHTTINLRYLKGRDRRCDDVPYPYGVSACRLECSLEAETANSSNSTAEDINSGTQWGSGA